MRKTAQRLLLVLVVVLISSALASCRPEPASPQEARLLILRPSAESTVSGSSVIIKVFIEFFSIAGKTGLPNVPGEGHIVYYRDVEPPLKAGESALTAAGSYIVTTETSYMWTGISPGEHTFWVQLVNNDNTPLQPPAAVYVPVTVR